MNLCSPSDWEVRSHNFYTFPVYFQYVSFPHFSPACSLFLVYTYKHETLSGYSGSNVSCSLDLSLSPCVVGSNPGVIVKTTSCLNPHCSETKTRLRDSEGDSGSRPRPVHSPVSDLWQPHGSFSSAWWSRAAVVSVTFEYEQLFVCFFFHLEWHALYVQMYMGVNVPM